MQIDPATGWLNGVRRVPSPFFDERPPEFSLELIVVHGISLPPGRFGGPWIDALFSGSLPALALGPHIHPFVRSVSELRATAHALVRRDGSVTQYVPFHHRAWHAGASSWRGRKRCNDFSVGIELEGCDDIPYADAQYPALARLIEALIAAYPSLGKDRLTGHSDIAPGRKTDPGPAFDWVRLKALVQ